MGKKSSINSNDELIKRIEAMDESVLPDKDEILRRLRDKANNSEIDLEKSEGNAEGVNNTDKSENDFENGNADNKSHALQGPSNIKLIVGMFFQFIFTVMGGGMFIAGLIAGFRVGWDTTLESGVANISIVLSIIGGIMFAIGIALAFILYKLALKRYISSKINKK